MTRKILLTITLLGCTAWMVAQSTPSSSDPSSPSSSTSSQSSAGQSSASDNSGMGGSQTTLQGCLSGSAGSYTLTDASGTQYTLQGDTSKLSADVNNEVEVKGTASSSSSASSTPGSSASSGASSPSSAGAKTFNVTKVKKISSSCTSGK